MHLPHQNYYNKHNTFAPLWVQVIRGAAACSPDAAREASRLRPSVARTNSATQGMEVHLPAPKIDIIVKLPDCACRVRMQWLDKCSCSCAGAFVPGMRPGRMPETLGECCPATLCRARAPHAWASGDGSVLRCAWGMLTVLFKLSCPSQTQVPPIRCPARV